tara:strand:+ start:3708 stop:3884 length:177 start_codon:yes stop_codon:yes gene_type:complete
MINLKLKRSKDMPKKKIIDEKLNWIQANKKMAIICAIVIVVVVAVIFGDSSSVTEVTN